MSSVLAVVPIILYLLTYTPRSTKHKAVALTASVIVALGVGLLGNFIRLLLIIVGSQMYGVDMGLQMFHYSPSAIYAFISVLAGFYIADKIGGIRSITPRPLKLGEDVLRIEWRYVVGVITILLLVATLFYGAVVLASGSLTGTPLQARIIKVGGIDDFIDKPAFFLFNNTPVRVLGETYNGFLTRVLGAITVHTMSIDYNGTNYYGYLEIVDTPGKLHTWQLCLTLQGYRVIRSWSQIINNTMIYHILVTKNNVEALISYVLFPIYLETPETIFQLYVRVSILTSSINLDVDQVLAKHSYVLSLIQGMFVKNGIDQRIMFYLGAGAYSLLIAVIVYLAAVMFPRQILYKLRKIFGIARMK